jgi:hypothetical protein
MFVSVTRGVCLGYLAAGVGLVGALLDAVADGVAVLVDLAHAPSAAVHLDARVCTHTVT